MKNHVKIFLAIISLLILTLMWRGIDRATNIRNHYSIGNKYYLIITDSIWVDVPNGLWLHLDINQYTPTDSIIYANEYNSFTKTWNEVLSANTSYTYHNEFGEPFILQVEEYIPNPNWVSVDIHPLTNNETINNINISYDDIPNEEFQLNLESSTKVIKFKFSKSNLEIIKPIIYEAWNIIQK